MTAKHLAYLSALALAACTQESAPTLDLEVSDADHVAGTFGDGESTLAFDISRSDAHYAMRISDGEGQPLLETSLVGALQTTSVLGGRLVMSGIPERPDPGITGDRNATAELEARPEARLFEHLGDALAAEDIDLALLDPPVPPIAGTIDYAPGYFRLFYQERRDWLSKAGAWPTDIYLRKLDSDPSQSQIWVSPWSVTASSFFLTAYNFKQDYVATRYWWGQAFTVTCVSFTNACNVRVSR